MSLISNALGVLSNFFQIGGLTGPGWNNSGGVIQARNAANSAFAAMANGGETVTGNFGQSGGTFGVNATGNVSVTGTLNVTIDSSSSLNIGGNTNSINIGKSGQTTNFLGNPAFSGATFAANPTGAASLGAVNSTSVSVGTNPTGSTVTTLIKGSIIDLFTRNSSSHVVNIGGETINFGLPNSAGTAITTQCLQIFSNAGIPFVTTVAQTLVEPVLSGSYALVVNNGQGDNTALGAQIVAGASASGGTAGAVLLDVQNADGTDVFQMVQNTDLVSVQMNPGANNTGSIGISSLLWNSIWATALNIKQILFTGTTQSTVGAAGSATVLPALPTGYMQISVAGTVMVVPYYAAS